MLYEAIIQPREQRLSEIDKILRSLGYDLEGFAEPKKSEFVDGKTYQGLLYTIFGSTVEVFQDFHEYGIGDERHLEMATIKLRFEGDPFKVKPITDRLHSNQPQILAR